MSNTRILKQLPDLDQKKSGPISEETVSHLKLPPNTEREYECKWFVTEPPTIYENYQPSRTIKVSA